MAFVNTTFPELKLKHGLQKSVVDPVSITGNGTREIRRRQNKWERFVWDIPARNLLEADKQAVLAFLRSVNMGQDSFLYRDPTIPTLTDVKLPRYTGGVNTRQLVIPYGVPDSLSLLDDRLKHPLYRASITGLTFKKNGTPITGTYVSGFDLTGFRTVSFSGVVGTDTITVSGTPLFVVRFNGTLGWNIQAMSLPAGGACGDVTPSVVELNDFQLVEVYEE